MTIYYIHEFSTGINVEILPDGSWRTRGYKVGEYMNSTLSQIPLVIERAIANDLFEVSKNRKSQKPTFVGREIRGNNGAPGWSVIAVVIPVGDEYGRFNSCYRYFLCQGADLLWVILDMINSYWQKYRRTPTFNPSEIREIGKPNHHNISKKPLVTLPSELNALASNHQRPLILQPGKVSDLQTINAMAEKIANGLPVSWAYDVEAVEHAERFLVIQAADEKAYQRLTSVDVVAMESVIRGLISGSQIKDEWIQALLQGHQITSDQWKKFFDDQGANTGIRQRNSSPQMVRLLTLRAIILPETLPEYLEWFGIDGKNHIKEDNKQKVSLEFQGQLKQYISQLKPLIDESMKSVLEQILTGKISIPAFSWLLTAPKSLWSSYRESLLQNVKQDLETIGTSFKSGVSPPEPSFLCGDLIWKGLQGWWLKPSSRFSYYQPFADLFESLGDYQLASYFYQVSKGVVPNHIFRRAFKNPDKFELWGLRLYRQVTWDEHLINLINLLTKYSLKLAPIFILVLTHWFFSAQGYKTGKQVGYQEGFNFTNKTKPALEKLISELLEDQNLRKKNVGRSQIINAIKNTFVGITDYTTTMEKGKPQDVEKFVNSIREYQNGGDGIIHYRQQTYQKLKQDIKKQLLE
ncbi:hypothetical protein VV11_002815 [Trichodesmium erythraeum 21-75]|nr:hypothetical protein [Trichodesmium erythraeum 21-75]